MILRLSATARRASRPRLSRLLSSESSATSTPGASTSKYDPWSPRAQQTDTEEPSLGLKPRRPSPLSATGPSPRPIRSFTESEAFSQLYTSVLSNRSTPQITTIPSLNYLDDILAKWQSDPIIEEPIPKTLFEETLDSKTLEIDACQTDYELLDWTSQFFTRQAELERPSNTPSVVDAQVLDRRKAELEVYPHLLTTLIRTFRDRYQDPHLALAVFDRAQHASINSYVRGCSTSTYNELLTTLWICFRDLEKVAEHLTEMEENGIAPDEKTRRLAESITMSNSLNERTTETWTLLQRIESLADCGRSSEEDV